MEMEAKKVSINNKTKGKSIPKNAKILTKDTDVTVREIENGYIVTKRVEVKYQVGDRTEYDYSSKEYYSKTDPLEVKIKDKSLAEAFDE